MLNCLQWLARKRALIGSQLNHHNIVASDTGFLIGKWVSDDSHCGCERGAADVIALIVYDTPSNIAVTSEVMMKNFSKGIFFNDSCSRIFFRITNEMISERKEEITIVVMFHPKLK